MASITANGFCAVAALSRYTRGLPWIVCFRTGKSSRTFSTSNPMESMLLAVLMEFLDQSLLQPVFQGCHLDPVQNILRKRVRQQRARITFSDAARLQVKHRFF